MAGTCFFSSFAVYEKDVFQKLSVRRVIMADVVNWL